MRTHRVRRLAVLSVLLTVGMLSTAVGGASAANWLAPQNVSLSVSDLGFDEHGNAIAVGVGTNAGGDPMIRAMTRPFGGQWSASVPVSGSGESDVQPPQVAVNPHGDAVAIWSADILGPAGVVRVSSRPAGGQWSAPTVISEGTVYDRDVDVAIDAQGNATAIWTEFSESATPNPAFIVRSASRPSGGDWSDPVNFSKSSLRSSARLAVDPQGNVTALWLGDGTTSPAVVRSKSRPAGGGWSSEVDLSSDDATASAEGPQLAVDAQGNVTAVWASHATAGGYTVQSSRRTATGDWSAAVNVGTGYSPQVAVDPQGNATAVWQQGSPSSSAVLSSSRTGAGPWSGAAPMAAGDDVDTVGYPWVAADAQGNVTAIWARFNSTDLLAQATHHVAGSTSWSPPIDLSVGWPITSIPAAGIDPQGHVSMVWSSDDTPPSGAGSIFDPVAPTLKNVVAPATATVGQPVALSVNGSDAWSAVTVSWDFGDGQAGSGAAVNHTYNSPGERTLTITGVDAAGNTTQTSRTITVESAAVPQPPGPGPGPGPGPRVPPPAPNAPILSGLQQSNPRWRTHRVKRGPRLPVGTTFRFKLDRAAQVRFAFSQIVSGRRVNGRCVKATKNNRSKRRCDRYQSSGTLNVAGKAGANTVAFSGKLRERTLPPGSYRVLVTAVADGKTSAAGSAQCTIAR
ncbi:MAG TPA: PKD domain-containing protein [Baekduia sp.]|nr:PKD domain-containing protein [Baekduia sp.]